MRIFNKDTRQPVELELKPLIESELLALHKTPFGFGKTFYSEGYTLTHKPTGCSIIADQPWFNAATFFEIVRKFPWDFELNPNTEKSLSGKMPVRIIRRLKLLINGLAPPPPPIVSIGLCINGVMYDEKSCPSRNPENRVRTKEQQ